MNYQIIYLLSALILSQLSGCASISDFTAKQLSSEAPPLAEQDYWKITGKLAIKSPHKAQSANLIWRQHNSRYKINITSPIGLGAVNITGNDQQATIQKGLNTLNGTPDQLGTELLGIPLSADAMRWWLKGLTSPNHPKASKIVFNENNRFSRFQQHGWQLQFNEYTANGPYMLPKKISGRRGDLSFKLVINQWNFYN
jgi:outer membrane lipoprotein LolB